MCPCGIGYKFKGPRIVVAVFGITYAEMRSMYEIMEKTKREIIVCCIDILTPHMFMQSLGRMSAPETSMTRAVQIRRRVWD